MATFYCALDGATFAPCASHHSAAGLSDGGHSFRVKAVDLAGNESATPSVSWTIDTTAPLTAISSVTPAGSLVSSTSMSLSFSSPESNATFVCSLDGAAATACTSPHSYSGLAQGAHSFIVRARDTLGNTDPAGASYSWSVDTIAPSTQAILASSLTASSAVITWTSNEPSTTQVRYGSGGVLSKSTSENMQLTTSHSITLTGLTAFTVYTYQVVSHDAAGNTGQSGSNLVFRTTR